VLGVAPLDASRITGSSPARDTRFGSSNVAVTTPGVCSSLT
jgi:hypothetical protein